MKKDFFLMSCLCMVFLLPVSAQSDYAIRFYGTGVGPPGQQDRILIPVDDNIPGANSSPIDISGSFTYEFWMRGQLTDNNTMNAGGGVEFNNYSWIEGNIILDRDVWCGTERNYGVSVMGGKIRFGVGEGDTGGSSSWTIEGSRDVLDGEWHHIAVIRDIQIGQISIVVDGVIDFTSSLGISQTDLSYPDAGIPVTGDCSTGQRTPYGWYLVVGAEKHDAGTAYPSFNGYFDELRIWNIARNVTQINSDRFRLIANDTPGLVANYRFEEGTGNQVYDSSVFDSPTGTLVAGLANNGEWVGRIANPNNTAPLSGFIFRSGFE